MKPGILLVAALCAAILPVKAQTSVVLSQKFKIMPFSMQAGAKLPGDHICKFFLLTHYGTPSAPAWIGFNHEKDKSIVSEVIKGKDARVAIEDTDAPFATRVEDADGTTWTIHLSKSDYDSGADCLKDIPRS